jgi:hypothetical protein
MQNQGNNSAFFPMPLHGDGPFYQRLVSVNRTERGGCG